MSQGAKGVADDVNKKLAKEVMNCIGVNGTRDTRSKHVEIKVDIQKLRTLLSKGVSPDACRDQMGTTALGVAAYHNLHDAVATLLAMGGRAHAENLDGATPLSMAAHGKAAHTMALILQTIEPYDASSDGAAVVDEALTDASATGATDVASVIDAWRTGSSHVLLEWAMKELAAERQQIHKQIHGKMAMQLRRPGNAESLDHRQLQADRIARLEKRMTSMELQIEKVLHRLDIDTNHTTSAFARWGISWRPGGRQSRHSRDSRRDSQQGRSSSQEFDVLHTSARQCETGVKDVKSVTNMRATGTLLSDLLLRQPAGSAAGEKVNRPHSPTTLPHSTVGGVSASSPQDESGQRDDDLRVFL